MAEEFAAPWWGLTKFCDPLRIPQAIKVHSWGNQDDLVIRMVRQEVKLHSQLPSSAVWAYEGQFPGPTIDVRSGERLRVRWTNDIEGTVPLVGVKGPLDSGPTSRPGQERDKAGYEVIEALPKLPGWTVTHLHGAHTNGGNDGWAHNAGLRGSSQLVEYPNHQRSMALWYHDHAMAVTRFNVLAGLAGMYLVRDDEEEALDLPSGDYEIPLVLCDRNLDTDPTTGALTGRLLFKVPIAPPITAGDPEVLIPFDGPFNLVNGCIWPYLEVEPRWYRFRLLNASNSRIYRLRLVGDAGAPAKDAAWLIGTDGGLLPAPVPLSDDGLLVAPAERFDLLIDFSGFQGQALRLTNADAGDVEPDLMQFRVTQEEVHDRFELPETISASYTSLASGTALPSDHDEVWVALLENRIGHPEMWDLAEVPAHERVPEGPGIIQVEDSNMTPPMVRTFRMIGRMFDDTVGVRIDHGRWAVWNIVHVGANVTHPIHIHLTEFQILHRRTIKSYFDVAAERTTKPVTVVNEVPLEKYEAGWKDTIIVNPGQWVSVAGQFEGGTGEFMFHCHILDHEDEGMMRPFVVRPREVTDLDPMGHMM